jgi:hypothetical protein
VPRLIVVCWLFGMIDASLMAFGLISAYFRSRTPSDSGATEVIMQITTVGNHDTVNSIIQSIRDYDLPFPYRIWVVTEPFVEPGFVGMDDLIVVPESFTALARYKARAQEFSRRLRAERGLARRDVKVIMLDDDTLPTRKYLTDAFAADYDVCEGITAPRLHYGRLLSHMDDLRTLGCLVYCSAFQGHSHPLWVHGEGLCVRGSAEQVVTWNYPIVASEDLVFGQNAVERGLTWGFLWEYMQLTSPWTIRDYIKQRRRWMWGNIYALRTGLIPPMATTMLVFRWVSGIVVGIFSTIGIALTLSHTVYVNPVWVRLLIVSLCVWLSMFAYACWIGASAEGRPLVLKIRDTAIGVLISPLTSFLTVVAMFIVFAKGDPKRFEVIAKTRPTKSAVRAAAAPTEALYDE